MQHTQRVKSHGDIGVTQCGHMYWVYIPGLETIRSMVSGLYFTSWGIISTTTYQ